MSNGRGSGIGRRAVSGAIAGAVGTAAMDLVWYRRYRRGGGKDSFVRWEFGVDVVGWADASAPGQLGRKVERLLSRREPPERWARTTTNVVHWATGIGWAALYGVLAGRSSVPWCHWFESEADDNDGVAVKGFGGAGGAFRCCWGAGRSRFGRSPTASRTSATASRPDHPRRRSAAAPADAPTSTRQASAPACTKSRSAVTPRSLKRRTATGWRRAPECRLGL